MITNQTTKTTLAKEAEHCKSVISKAKGLMFTKKIKDKGLIFHFNKEKIVALHMFFVFYPIDILFLDKNQRIVEIKKQLKPFATYMPKNKAKYVIELPANSIKNTRIKDKIKF